MQPASNRRKPSDQGAGTRSRPEIDLSKADHAVASALEERLASGRPMPRSLRRAYEQLMARESGAERRSESADSKS